MALSRVKTWIAGDILTAADQNAEFNNILNNPISLISPTTAAINFSTYAHTNLIPTAINATSGSTGAVLTISTAGTPVWTSSGLGAGGVNPGLILSAGSAVFTTADFPALTKSTELGRPEMMLAYDPTTKEEAYFSVPLSTNISAVSSATIEIWYVTTSSLGVVWQIGSEFMLTGSSGGGKSTSVSSTANSTGLITRIATGLTASSWAPPGVALIRIDRLVSDAGDTNTGDARLWHAALRITV